jgi:MFS family permease
MEAQDQEINPEEDLRLLKNPRFRHLLASRMLGQTAYNAVLYALLILVVTDTGSSVQSTFLIVAFTLPSAIFGIPGGALADILPKRFTLTAGYFLRGAIVAALFFYADDVFMIFVLAAATATVNQVFAPAESATVPALVRDDQLPAANALMVLTMVMGQIAGMVVLAPILLKLISAQAVFSVAVVIYFGSAYIVGWLARDFTAAEEARTQDPGFIEVVKEGFRILRTNRMAYLAIVYLTTSFSLLKVLVVLLPKYTEDVLDIRAEDAVFVAAPAALGAGLGLALVPLASRLFGAWRVVAAGFIIFLLCLIGMGMVVYVRDFIQTHLDLGITFAEEQVGVSSVITVSMILAVPIGFAFSLVSVGARVVLNRQAPPRAQGRVFAVQMAVGDVLSLAPLLVIGVMADVVGVRGTLLASALAAMLAAGYLTFSKRFGPPAGPPVHTLEPAPEAR